MKKQIEVTHLRAAELSLGRPEPRPRGLSRPSPPSRPLWPARFGEPAGGRSGSRVAGVLEARVGVLEARVGVLEAVRQVRQPGGAHLLDVLRVLLSRLPRGPVLRRHAASSGQLASDGSLWVHGLHGRRRPRFDVCAFGRGLIAAPDALGTRPPMGRRGRGGALANRALRGSIRDDDFFF
jgi:hypothetical protein